MRKRLLSLAVAALCMAGITPVQAQTYDKEPASVAWNFNTTADYDKATTVTPDGGFATTAVNIGDIEVTGTGTGQATDASGEKVTLPEAAPVGLDKSRSMDRHAVARTDVHPHQGERIHTAFRHRL